MPSIGKAKLQTQNREPNRLPAVTAGCEPGWDLSKINDDTLVAELVRRGRAVPQVQQHRGKQPLKKEVRK